MGFIASDTSWGRASLTSSFSKIEATCITTKTQTEQRSWEGMGKSNDPSRKVLSQMRTDRARPLPADRLRTSWRRSHEHRLIPTSIASLWTGLRRL